MKERKEIDALLDDFIRRRLDRKGRMELRRLISGISDAELGERLQERWMAYDEHSEKVAPVPELPVWSVSGESATALRTLIGADEAVKLPARRRKIWSLVARTGIAAAVILLISMQFYFRSENHRMHEFLTRQVTVEVRSGQKSEVTLPDGTKVALNSATKLSYPLSFGFSNRQVSMDGEAWFEVVSDAAAPFRVNTNHAVIEVFGTKFNVKAYSDSPFVETTLVEGSVMLRVKGKEGVSARLSPFDKAVYDRRTGEMTVTSTTTYFETAWVRGELVFRSASLNDMVLTLERRYGVDITMRGRYPSDLFTGTFREDNIMGVLDQLRIHYNFRYKYVDQKIEITFK